MRTDPIIKARDAQVQQAFPGAVLWTREQAELATGLCHKTLAKHVKPLKIGRAVRWRPADVQRFVDGLIPGGEQ